MDLNELNKMLEENARELIGKPDEMAAVLREKGYTPYNFFRFAMNELMAGNHEAAVAWSDYAFRYLDFYKDDAVEQKNYSTACLITKGWLEAMKRLENQPAIPDQLENAG